MILQAGLSHADPYWQLFLEQEKIPWELWDGQSAPDPQRFPVLILNRACPESWIASYLKGGGSLVLEGDGTAPGGWKTLGPVETVPFRLERAAPWRGSRLKKFKLDDMEVTETVAAAPYAPVRRQLREILRRAFWARGLPLVHGWYYPNDYQSVFSFRFDLDEYDAEDFDRFLQLVKRYGSWMTCFPSMKTYESRLDALRRLADLGVDFGSHAYVHHVYASRKQNHWNLERAEALLKPVVGTVRGFSAPHGTWHPSLQAVLEERGYGYSSEFGLDYDNLPYYPWQGGRFSPVLQIPTHPVCEGVFFEHYGPCPERVAAYLNRVLAYKLRDREPALFFGHPTRRIGRYPEIFELVARQVESRPEVWKTDFRSWAAWWERRAGLQFTIKIQDGKICGTGGGEDLRLAVWSDPERVQLVSFQDLARGVGQPEIKQVPPMPAVFSPVQESIPAPGMGRKIRQAVKAWLDWEIKTPRHQLFLSEPRNWPKRALRLMYDRIRSQNG